MIAILELLWSGAGAVLAELFRISFWGAAFIVGLAIVLRLARGFVPPRVQCWLWWLACLRLFTGFVPVPGFALEMPEGLEKFGRLSGVAALVAPAAPVAEPAGAGTPSAPVVGPADAGQSVAPDHLLSATSPLPATTPFSDEPNRERITRDIAPLLLAVWILGAVLGLVALGIDWFRARRFLRTATPWSGAKSDGFARLCRREGVARIPRVLVSGSVRVPQVIGVRRPVILLPDLFDRLDPVDREMALCHELAHLRRNDLFWGWAPALAVRVFWFHPLVRLAAREYVVAREAACDVEVLRSVDTAPWSYGRLLVLFARSPRGPLPGAAGVALGTSSLKRRLEMLRTSYRNDRAPLAWGALALAVIIGILPVRLVGAPADAKPSAREKSEAKSKATSRWVFDDDNEHQVSTLIILDADHDDITMMGNTDEIDGAKRARRQSSAPTVVWFRTQEGTWLLEDEALVDTIVEAFGPVNALGEKQGELGSRQGELGEKQGELGERQAQLGMEQARLSLRISELSSRMARRQQEGRGTDDIQAELEELQEEMEAVSWAQGEMGAMQGELGERQGELGALQGELGALQSEESQKLRRTLDGILMEAVRNGVARPVR
jgi:bla regulator protein BlaR1